MCGFIRGGGLKATGWLKDLYGLRLCVGVQKEDWFEASMGRRLGNRESSFFYNNRWLEGGLLRVRFGRLSIFMSILIFQWLR